jgi:hypothetical protein
MHGQEETIPKGKIFFDNKSMPISDDELCRIAFGLSFEQLILAIRNNQGGKYDYLYSKDKEGKNEN